MISESQHIERIFSGEFDPKESQPLNYNPSAHHKRATGLLLTADASVSLAFSNGTDLQLNQIEFAHKDEATPLSPNDRIFKLDHDINDEVITGTVTNLKTAGGQGKRTINVYLIVEHDC